MCSLPAREQIPSLSQRGDQRDRPHAAIILRGQEHARVARMDRKRQHAPAEWGDRAGCIVDGAQVGEQRLGAFQRARVGRFEPAECSYVIDAARLEREDHLGEIEPFHFGKFLGERARSAHARSTDASNGPARCGRRDRRVDRRRRG